jgi:CIC family chloride channel protein
MVSFLNKIYYSLSRRYLLFIKKIKMTENAFIIGIAIIIGILAGFGAILFRAMIKAISDISFSGTGNLLNNIIATPWYIKLLAPAAGGLVIGPLIYFFAKEAKGHGVPEVMESLILRGGVLRPRLAFFKAVVSSICIGTGGSVGREGPIVGVGASLGSTIGQLFRVSPSRMKTFVGCGTAAGIAGAFNAPIAGAFFAVEILLGDFTFRQFSPIVISSVMATVISHNFEGNIIAFQVPQYQLTSPYELLFYFTLGLLCGAVSYLFIKALYFSEDIFDKSLNIPPYLKPAVGGLLIGIIALYFPHVMGVGYDSIDLALQGKIFWYFAFILIFIKIIATSISIGSGGSGGIFAPSLFLGSMLGFSFGLFIHGYFPNITALPGAYALVAMGGLVAGSTHAPITAIIIVFELTNDYSIILPLMITCIISTLLSAKLSRESIYTLKLLRRNIHIKDGAEINVMKSILVKGVYTPHVETIEEYSNFNDVVNRVISGQDPYFPVIDRKGYLTGIISIHDIKDHLFERDTLQNVLIARDIAFENVERVSLEDNCQTVLEKLSEHNLEGIPVVDSRNHERLIGMIWRKDVLDAYHKEIERRDITSTFASRITRKNIDQDVHFMEGYAIIEIAAPKNFVGKTIKELNIRAVYGVDVILIRTNTQQGSKIKAIPNPDYRFSYDDSLVIAGEIGKLNLIKSIN